MADSSSQTGPEHWLFANLTELTELAPHFLPTGWCVVTYSCNAEDGLCLGFAHNLYHPQLQRFVCDRAIYVSQLSYSVGSVPHVPQEAVTSNRFDGFRIICEQYYVGGPTGKKEKYESIVFIQYLSDLLKIIETLDKKSTTLLLLPEGKPSHHRSQESTVDTEAVGFVDTENFHTFRKMFSQKVSSRGRTIQPSSKVDESLGKKRDKVPDSKNDRGVKIDEGVITSTRDEPMDTVTISDADGNVLAQIQDPSLSLSEGTGGVGVTEEKSKNPDRLAELLLCGVKPHLTSEVSISPAPDAEGDVKNGWKGADSKKGKSSKMGKRKSKKLKRKCDRSSKEAQSSTAKNTTARDSAHTVLRNFDFDSDTSTWKCDICQSSFARSEELATHLSSHPDLKRYRCELCGSRFTLRHNLSFHAKTVHDGQRNFKCDVCGKAFMKGHDLRRHASVHDTTRNGLVCEYCKKVYYTQQNFDLHVAGHEGDDKGFRWCLVCGLKLRYHQHKYHMKKHRGPADCFDCNQTFNNVHILRRHIKTNHGDQRVQCPDCEETFNSKTEWKAHSRATHNAEGTNISQCKICLRTFAYSKQLELHAAAHSSELRPPKSRRRGGGGASRKAMVDVLPASSTDLASLSRPAIESSHSFIPREENELTAIQVDGQTFIIHRQEESSPAGDGDMNDLLVIPQIQEVRGAVLDEDPNNTAQTIWIEGAAENLAFAMIQ